MASTTLTYMRILITGGAGFIGSHLCDRLLADGHRVTVLDDFSTGKSHNLKQHEENSNLELISGSILNLETLEKVIAENEYVFHLAAAVGVFNIVNNPLGSLLTNLRGTENVLEVCKNHDVPFFLSSSSEVYGKNIANSLTEDTDRILGSPTKLRWTYSEAKALDESLAYAYHVEKNLEIRIVRFFNTVGPRQLGTYGMVLPRFVKSALENKPITIYGSGLQTRCFAHVLDVIDAVIDVAFSKKTIGKVINIGNNFEISMNDLATLIVEMTNSESKIEHIPYSQAYAEGFEDMERRVPSIELINQLVGWKPQRDLPTIIADISDDMKRSS